MKNVYYTDKESIYEIKCALCGFEFSSGEAQCSRCPISRHCKVICCPHCGYQMVDELKMKEKISKIWVAFMATCRIVGRCFNGSKK